MDEEDQCVECGNQLDHGEFEASEILKGKRLCWDCLAGYIKKRK